jgi:hypothetical protein
MELQYIYCVLDAGSANLYKWKYCIQVNACLDNMSDAVAMFFFAGQCYAFQAGFRNGKDNTNRSKPIKKILSHKKVENFTLKKAR